MLGSPKVLVAAVALLTLAVSGCGSGSTTTAAQPGPPEGVGPITFAIGKSMAPTTSSFVRDVLARWNADHADQKATLVNLPEDADGQRETLVTNARARSAALDVVVIDNVWSTEFAANGYLDELPAAEFHVGDFLPPVVAASMYGQRLYTVPTIADAGLLYYRTDLLAAVGVAGPPRTWAEMYEDCTKVAALPQGAGVDCYAGQLRRYEGLTANFAEAVASAGGEIMDGQGVPRVDTPQARAALDFLVGGVRSGAIAKDALDFDEEAGRQVFQDGRLVFQRQWPYQFEALSNTDGSSKVAGKFGVARLPGLTGPGAAALGGHAMGISTYSTHKTTAMEFVKYYTSIENSRKNLLDDSKAPVYTSLYEDPALRQQFPFLPVLKESILNAALRPKVVRYGDVTQAIQQTVHSALTGESSSEAALRQLQARLGAVGR